MNIIYIYIKSIIHAGHNLIAKCVSFLDYIDTFWIILRELDINKQNEICFIIFNS